MQKIIGLAVAFLIVLSAAAMASIPDSNGVIHGCHTKAGGEVRVIDTDQGQHCTRHERALDWNRRGRRGPEGIQGEQGVRGKRGPRGIQGIQGDPGATSPSVTYLTATSLFSGDTITQTLSWSQPAGTVATHVWARRTFTTPPGPCDSLSDTGGVAATLKLNGIDVFPNYATSSPGTRSFPTLGGDPLGDVLFPGDYDLVVRISGQLDEACWGTEVTTEVFVETVAGV